MDKITTIDGLKEFLKQDITDKEVVISCDIDSLLICPLSLKAYRYKMTGAIIKKKGGKSKKKDVKIYFNKDGEFEFEFDFILDGKNNLLINNEKTTCVFDKENLKWIKEMLAKNRNEHIKTWLDEIKNINKDYADVVKSMILYDSKNK